MKTSLRIVGNLGKDAIVNSVNGKTVINFSVASTEKFKDAAGNVKEATTWTECSQWTDRTGLVPFLKKGVQVMVEGKPGVRAYTTQDGRHGASLTMRVSGILLLGSKNENVASPTSDIPVPAAGDISEPLDDMPF